MSILITEDLLNCLIENVADNKFHIVQQKLEEILQHQIDFNS